jgi:hypothetical protein
MSIEERRALIAKLAALPRELEALVRPLPADALTARPAPGDWSVAQIVHHIADAHMNAFVRVKLILTEEHPTFKPWEQEAWGEQPEAQDAAVGDSLDIVRGLHARWVRLLEGLPDEAWRRTGLQPATGRVHTIEDILRTYANHGEAHLEQIRGVLATVA